MSGFNSPKYREVSHEGRDNQFRLEEALVFKYSIVDGERTKRIVNIRVPKGFETNFLSIPWFMRWLFDPTGPGMRASIIHDYLYYCPEVPREFGDMMFRIGLHVLGIGRYKRLALYYAVRIFGGFCRVTKDDIEGK